MMKGTTDQQKIAAFREATEMTARGHARYVWMMQEEKGRCKDWVDANWKQFVPNNVAHLMEDDNG